MCNDPVPRSHTFGNITASIDLIRLPTPQCGKSFATQFTSGPGVCDATNDIHIRPDWISSSFFTTTPCPDNSVRQPPGTGTFTMHRHDNVVPGPFAEEERRLRKVCFDDEQIASHEATEVSSSTASPATDLLDDMMLPPSDRRSGRTYSRSSPERKARRPLVERHAAMVTKPYRRMSHVRNSIARLATRLKLLTVKARARQDECTGYAEPECDGMPETMQRRLENRRIAHCRALAPGCHNIMMSPEPQQRRPVTPLFPSHYEGHPALRHYSNCSFFGASGESISKDTPSILNDRPTEFVMKDNDARDKSNGPLLDPQHMILARKHGELEGGFRVHQMTDEQALRLLTLAAATSTVSAVTRAGTKSVLTPESKEWTSVQKREISQLLVAAESRDWPMDCS